MTEAITIGQVIEGIAATGVLIILNDMRSTLRRVETDVRNHAVAIARLEVSRTTPKCPIEDAEHVK